jgi:hypothetical protein
MSDRLASYLQSLFQSGVLLTLESMDFYFELELPTLKFINCLRSSFASHADAKCDG